MQHLSRSQKMVLLAREKNKSECETCENEIETFQEVSELSTTAVEELRHDPDSLIIQSELIFAVNESDNDFTTPSVILKIPDAVPEMPKLFVHEKLNIDYAVKEVDSTITIVMTEKQQFQTDNEVALICQDDVDYEKPDDPQNENMEKGEDYNLNSDAESQSSENETSEMSTSKKENNIESEREGATSTSIKEERVRSKKRQRNPNNWEKNVLKSKRNSGQCYVTKSGKMVAAKKVREACGSKCKLRCTENISILKREEINAHFWKLGNIDDQRNYIITHTSELRTKYQKQLPNRKRSYNLNYKFPVDGNDIIVCKTFFMKTLDISSKMIFTTCKKKSELGFVEKDQRGKHGNYGRAIDPQIKEDIRCHIKSFPFIESHFCRARTSKKYIEGNLNLAIMYRLYIEQCNELEKPYGKQSMYSEIFNTEFNIGFFQPKKDQCSLCHCSQNSNDIDREAIREKYEIHQKEKELSRKEKAADILSREGQPSQTLAVYDLQSVLSVPCGDVSEFFYKSRLSCYNLTVYDIGSKRGYCFFWNQSIAQRGANEIGSCVYSFIKEQTKAGVSDITFYSDNCNGQNKNKFVISMYLYCIHTIDKLDCISHKFLIAGHTQNEGDSMHSLIEREKKRKLRAGPIYVPSQWTTIMELSKKKRSSLQSKRNVPK